MVSRVPKHLLHRERDVEVDAVAAALLEQLGAVLLEGERRLPSARILEDVVPVPDVQDRRQCEVPGSEALVQRLPIASLGQPIDEVER